VVRGTWFVVGVCIDGRGLFPFVVDTGTSTTVVDAHVATLLRLPVMGSRNASGVGCQRSVSLSAPWAFSLGGIALEPQVVDVGTLSSPAVPDLDGLIGSDVLSRFGAVRFDFGSGRLVLGSPEQPALTSSVVGTGRRPRLPDDLVAGTTAIVPAQTDVLLAPYGIANATGSEVATLSGVAFDLRVTPTRGPGSRFLLDTGAMQTTVSESFAKLAGLPGTGKSARGLAGLTCPVYLSAHGAATWELAGEYLGRSGFDSISLFSPAVFSTALPEGIAGVLGAGTLARYSPIVVDYKDGELLLRHAPTNTRVATPTTTATTTPGWSVSF
jgi:hypothetical protein